ncbi:MAG: hypothetical protein Fur0010_22020 [Bdellovibrio sp.]
MSERSKIALLIFFLFALYFVGINDRGMFHDGYLYAAYGKHAITMNRWLIPHLSHTTYAEFFHHTPFLFILEGLFFKFVGVSYASARIFILLFLIVTAFYFFGFIKREKGHLVAVLWLLFFLLLPPLLKKSRFPNIDLPLMMFTTLSLVCAFQAITKEKNKYWWGSGFMFGLALLTKGPLALHIALVIFLFLVIEKKLFLLKKIVPWAAFLFGFALFALWPLGLKIYERMDIFYQWVHFIFVESIFEGRGEKSPFLTYFKFLLVNAPLWSLLIIFGFYQIKKKTLIPDALYRFSLLWFAALIIPLSFMGLKYSNYLIPAYPAFALLSLYPILKLRLDVQKKIVLWSMPIVFIGLAGSLFYNFKYKSYRDEVIYEAIDYAREKNLPMRNWILYNDCYPFFSLQNLLAFEASASVHQISNTRQFNLDALVIIHKADVGKIENLKKLKDLSVKDLVLACVGSACLK